MLIFLLDDCTVVEELAAVEEASNGADQALQALALATLLSCETIVCTPEPPFRDAELGIEELDD